MVGLPILLTKEKVLLLGEKFILTEGICLEVPGKNEQFTEGTVMRVAFHKESLNTGLKISILPTMADLLCWYNYAQHSWSLMLGRLLLAFQLDGSSSYRAQDEGVPLFLLDEGLLGVCYISPRKEFSFPAGLLRLRGWKS